MKRTYFYYIIGFVIININLYASNPAADNPVYKDNNAIQAPAGSGSNIANLLSFVNKARALIIFATNISASAVKDGPGPALKAGIGFTATKGSDGKFYAEDIDIRANVEGSLTLGVINVAGGVEASAMRDIREYANISVTGDKYLDDFKEKEKKFKWLPSIGKEIWSGEYREIMIKEFSR